MYISEDFETVTIDNPVHQFAYLVVSHEERRPGGEITNQHGLFFSVTKAVEVADRWRPTENYDGSCTVMKYALEDDVYVFEDDFYTFTPEREIAKVTITTTTVVTVSVPKGYHKSGGLETLVSLHPEMFEGESWTTLDVSPVAGEPHIYLNEDDFPQ